MVPVKFPDVKPELSLERIKKGAVRGLDKYVRVPAP